jgi:arylsulfatase A-like enzyme
MLNRLFPLAAMTVTAACAAAEPATPPAKPAAPPNIIMFLVDDMGWQDTSVPFWDKATPLNQKFHTPNMERLAAQGVKFTQAYACPVCSPTRVSLLTGLSAARHRVTNWTLKKDKSSDAGHAMLEFPAWNLNGLQPAGTGIPRTVEAKCLPEYLRGAGYRTIMVGKAHFGAVGTPGADPLKLGFDVNIGGHAAGGPGSYLGEQKYSARFRGGDGVWDVPNLEKYHGTDTFLTEALTIEALKATDQARADKKPFFLYMSHYAVHVPYAPDKRFIEKYQAAGLDKTEAMYAALVEGMDKSLGDIMDYLEKNQLADNTVILFMSDNGGITAGRGGKAETQNLPLSRGKGALREGGIREPMIVKWPGVTKPGSVCADYLIIEDFFPTILEMAGTKAEKPVDGISFVPLLKGEAGSAERPLLWHQPNNWGSGSGIGYGSGSAVRLGDWKYIFYHNPAQKVREELFNLREDIGETNNLAAANPAKLAEMRKLLKECLVKNDAQMPTDKKTKTVITVPQD